MDKELEEWLKLHKFYLYSDSYQTKALANYLGVSPRTIDRWIREKNMPNKEQSARIKMYLEANKAP